MYRTTLLTIPPSPALLLTFYHLKLPPFLANGCFLPANKLPLIARLVLEKKNLNSFKFSSLHGAMTSLTSLPPMNKTRLLNIWLYMAVRSPKPRLMRSLGMTVVMIS